MTKDEMNFWGIKDGDIELELEVLNFLKSRDEYVIGDIIVNGTSVKNTVQLRSIINTLRKDDNPIVGSSKGYKYSTDKVELIQAYSSMKSRANDMMEAARGLLRASSALDPDKNNI